MISPFTTGTEDPPGMTAVIPGGSSVPVVKGDIMMGVNMDYDSIASVGSMLGSGGVIVMDDRTCMVSVLHRISRFYYSESCGHKIPNNKILIFCVTQRPYKFYHP